VLELRMRLGFTLGLEPGLGLGLEFRSMYKLESKGG
jgi:hypothetical protein